jgi:hypothetical protein
MISAHPVSLLSAVDTTTKIKKIKAPRVSTPSAADTTKPDFITSDNESVGESRDLPLFDAGVTPDFNGSNNEMINAHRMSLPASNPIGWKLSKIEFTETIFNKKKMREYPNIGMVHGFISNEMGISMFDYKRYDGMLSEIHTELDFMRAFRERYKKNHFSVAHKLPKHGWGRTIPCDYLSLSIMRRGTRHALCNSIYRDLDLVNAHATIIYEIGTQNELALSSLKQIVDDPKGWRKTICEHHGLDFDNPAQRDIAKTLPLSLFFGGAYKVWIRENNIEVNKERLLPVLIGVENELRTIREIVFTNNPQIFKDVIRHNGDKWKDTNAAKRGVMAMWAQTIERRIMEDAVTFLVEKRNFKLEDIVPCQDGLMILKELFYEGIERDFEQLAHEKYGFRLMRWVEKPFDEAIEIPVNSDIRKMSDWIDELSTKRLAERLMNVRKKEYIPDPKEPDVKKHYTLREYIRRNSKEGSVYVYFGDRWYNESSPKKIYLLRYVSEDLHNDVCASINAATELSDEDRGKLLIMARNKTSDYHAKIIEHALSIADDIPSEGFDSKPYLLGFTNGVVDLRTKEFRNYQFDDYITLTTRRAYRIPDYEKPEDADRLRVMNGLLDEIQDDPERRKLLTQIMASGLDGIPYQYWWFFIGTGGNGKGLLGAFMKHTLGKDLSYYPPSDVLKEVAKGNTGCSPNIADLLHKRYIVFEEMGGKVDQVIMKKLTGGGEFTARQPYCGNIHFKLSATFIGEMNDPPEFNAKLGDAEGRRMRSIGFDNNWTVDQSKVDRTNEKTGRPFKPANEYYSSDAFREDMADVFLDILLDCYKASFVSDGHNPGFKFDVPDSVTHASKQFINDTNVFQICFNSLYEAIVPVPEDLIKNRVYCSSIWNQVQNCDVYRTGKHQKPREYSRNWGKKEFYRWIREFTTVLTDSDKRDFILSHRFAEDGDAMDVEDEDGEDGVWGEM